MTDLIQSQLKVIAVMAYCGLTAGLIIDVFRLFISRFFKNKKPTSVFFLYAFDQLQKMNDKIQEIIEEVYLTEMKAGTEPSIEVAARLDARQMEDPIETFLAILTCLQSNALIIETIRNMDI